MGVLWSRLRQSSSSPTKVEQPGAPPLESTREKSRGRTRTRTPPAPLRKTKSSTSRDKMTITPQPNNETLTSSPVVAAKATATTATATEVVVPNSKKALANHSISTTPHEFVWKYGGNKVILTGSFDEWSQSILMVRDHANELFRATVNLDPSRTWYFKFVVDNVWRCSLDFCTETDGTGNVNNVLYPDAVTTTNSP